ncbi:hypothetical protein EVA_08383 [gut metagenome]|uniref:Uncharacterized protein n=1 Tax=gut metagenome TaxID=749906 RepID=J9G9H0_9ZZZZ
MLAKLLPFPDVTTQWTVTTAGTAWKKPMPHLFTVRAIRALPLKSWKRATLRA